MQKSVFFLKKPLFDHKNAPQTPLYHLKTDNNIWHSLCFFTLCNLKIYTDMMKNTKHSTATTAVYGSEEMVTPAPTTTIPEGMTTPEIAYNMVKDETSPQPRNIRNDIHG